MTSDPNEPENFTLDQMMERLKERSNPDKPEGEWVTRADGSQAYKVRRRRRRSHQPHKDAAEQQRRTRAMQIVGVALVLAVLIAMFAGLMVYVNTPGYREQRLAMVESSTGAKAEVVQLRIMPHVAHMASLSMTWPEGGILRSLNAGQVKAELRPTSLLGKVWRGAEVLAQEVRVTMDQPPGRGATAAAAPAAIDDAEKFPFQFQNFRTSKFSLQMGDPKHPAVALSECEAVYLYDAKHATAELLLNRGKLNVADWSQLQVDRGLFHMTGQKLEVVNLFLIDPGNERGRIILTGTLPLQGQPGSLGVKVQRVSLSTLLGTQLGTLMGGAVDTDDRQPELSTLRVTPGSMADSQLTLTLRNQFGMSVHLAGLPCLKLLAEAVHDDWYVKPNIETSFSASVVRRGAETSLQQLDGATKNRMALRGGLHVDARQQLSGTLELGLPPEIIASSDDAAQLETLFSSSHDGLRWTTVKLGGSAQQPSDDLAPRLMQLRQGAQSSAPAPKTQKNPNEQRFQELTR